MYNYSSLQLITRSFAFVIFLFAFSQINTVRAVPLPSGFSIEFNVGAPSGLNGAFDGPDSYNYAFDGATGPASGSTGIFDNTDDNLTFDISGNYIGDSQNAFIVPVTLTLSNTDPLSLINVGLDVSYLVSASHAGLGLSSVALRYNNGLIPLDSAEADDPFLGFTGDVTNQLFDVSGIPSFSVGATSVVAELALVFEQFHTGPFSGPEFSDYSVQGEIGIGSIEVIPIVDVPTPPTLLLMALGLLLISRKQLSKFIY